ncbi:MAG TPA: FecR domain-containing protein [Verrucomicrobiales bacterium]|jgi:ferric-dicitrate binding protein FerR (iron transport regulator)|nr:FecR domain-containing protein [Verrucomicrobiales bacterium]
MNPPPSDADDFLQRAVRWQDGSLTEPEVSVFEQEMMASEEKRKVFAEVQMRSMLMNEILRRQAYAHGGVTQISSIRSRRSVIHRLRWVWPAVAALLLVGVVALVWRPGRGPSVQGLAVVSFEHVTEWEEGRGPVNGQLKEGGYSLTSGTVRLTMAHDATVATLAGPARFDIVAPGNIRLHEGRLSAQVSNPDAGFTVLTDALTVLDRGTVFGVDVRSDGEALVSVVEGKVDVATPGSQQMERIEQGGRVVAHPKRPRVRQPATDAVSGFEDLWPLTMGVDGQSNLVEFVVPRAKHRWNDYRSDTRLFLMPERQRVKPEGSVSVDIAPGVPLDKKRRDHTGHPLTAPGKVNSYLLFFRPAEGSPPREEDISGSITFSRPVLGIIADGERLISSDETYGHPRVTYRDKPRRGIEQWKKKAERDVVRISRDGRRVYFNLHTTGDPDEFRVLVSAP